MASEDLLAGVEFGGKSADLLEGVQVGAEPYTPRKDVGFWETAGRTAAQATSPVLRAIDMAAAGLAGAFERILPGMAGEQDRIFKMMQERQQGMQEFYGQRPEEQFNLPGSIAGGVASMPVEMAGGMGLQHGIERSSQVLEAGGTGRQAALAGGTTAAVRGGLNLLPVKVGGKIGAAVESKLGGILGGGLTGAALNVPAGALGTAAENLAVPAAEGSTLAQRARGKGLAPGMEQLGQDPLDPTSLATSAGLAAGMGGVGGALARQAKKNAPSAPPIPDTFEPKGDGEFKAPNGATVTKEQWDNASDRVRQGWLKEPKAEEKIPAGEAKEVEPPKLTDVVEALPPEGDRNRRAEIERLMGETNSDEVKATLKRELGKLDKAQKDREAVAKKGADKAELLAAARLAEDPDVKQALLARAEKVLPTEKVPAGEAKEVPVETIEPTPEPEPIPAGEATELKVEAVEPAKAPEDVPREATVTTEGKPHEEDATQARPQGQETAGKEAAVPTDATAAPAGLKGKKNATPEVGLERGVQQERVGGDESRQATEAGGGNRLQREAEGPGQEVAPEEVAALRKKWKGLDKAPDEVVVATEAWDKAKQRLAESRRGGYERANEIGDQLVKEWGQARIAKNQVAYLNELTKRLDSDTEAFRKREATPGTLENARAKKEYERQWQAMADHMHKADLEEINLGEKELRELHRQGRITGADIEELAKISATSKDSHETATRLHEILAGKEVEGREGAVGKEAGAANEDVSEARAPSGQEPGGPQRGHLFESEDDFDKALRAKFGHKMIDALRKQGLLHYMSGQEGGVSVHTKGKMIERSDDTSHARLYWDQIKRHEAPAVLMHEIGEHFGIVRVLGDEHYRVLLGELAEMHKTGDKEVRQAWETVRTRYPDVAEGSPRFIREVAAHLVESAPDMPWVRKIIAQVRAWLYQHFGTTLATRADGDLIRGLAWAALRKLEAGDLPRQDKAAMPRYMRSSEPVAEFSSEMRGDPSIGGAPPRVEPLGEEQRSEMLSRKFFDRFNRVAKVQKAAGITDESKDIYLADTLYRGRVQHEGDKLLRDYIEPLGKLLKEAKVEDLTVKDADDYLMALHAPERNAVIAARNDKMPDGGSGLTNQQAADIIDSFTPAQRQHLDGIASMVHRLNREKLQRMVDGGLITPETRDMLNRQYRNYVPLKTLDEEDAALGIGRGYELRATDITTAMGRKSKAGSPIAASIMDASRVIIRSEKANVDRTIWNFATDPAAEAFMRPYDPENPPATVMTRKIGPDGKVKDVIDPLKVQDQTISLMVNGEQRRIFVDDDLLRDQIRKVATSNDPGGVLRAIGQGTGTIGRMLTEFNPAFTLPNAVRDAWTVGMRAPAHGISRWRAVAGIPKAWGAIVNYKRGANTPGARAYEEFQRVGGKIGAYGIQGVADTFRNLEKAGASLGYDEQKGGLTRKSMETLRSVAHVFSQANEVFEYATRLSAYEQARAAGHSQRAAAAIAKDITVNFERSGEYGRVMNSLLVFANAALQGLYGTVRYASNPAVQRGMLGMVALGIASQAWNELMGGVNEETGEPNINTQSDNVADKNLVGLAPDSKSGFKIPLPQEYAALYAMGRRLYRGASQGDWAKEAGGVTGALIDAALPVRLPEAQSGALAVGKALVPTLAAPFADIWTNQNYFGAPIYVEQRDTTSPAPYHTLTRPQTSLLAKSVSEMLNAVTGGDEIEPGWSQRALGPVVAPEGIEHLVGFYTGGAGQFVMQSANLAKAATGDKTAVELNRTPVVNRFAFNEPTSYIGRRYREIEGKLEYARDKLKAGKDIDDEKLERALPVFEDSARELSTLRRELREAANSGGDVEEIRGRMRAAQSRVIRSYNSQPLE